MRIGSICFAEKFKIFTQITNHWYNLSTEISRGKSNFIMQFMFYVKNILKTFSRFQFILQCGWSCSQKAVEVVVKVFYSFSKLFPLGWIAYILIKFDGSAKFCEINICYITLHNIKYSNKILISIVDFFLHVKIVLFH